ncbi:helix-turn-helix domain-containing protein [Achromobacter xylosoxidans]|uniref:helix-turn-helix domain-containing protein n=1 Tax=Alcaligenes xylosoxydans xylosoxydans TaxID=85698 RepID=UPI0013648E7C
MSNDFGTCLERLRKRRDMHANRLASLADVDPSYITLLERGRRPPPRDAVLKRLIAALLLTPCEEEMLTRAALNELTLLHIERINGQTAARELARRIFTNDSRLREQDYRIIDSVVQAVVRERTAESDRDARVASIDAANLLAQKERTM